MAIGSFIGAGLSAIGALAGGIGQRRNNRRARRELDRQAKANEDWFNREYYQDYTQRADTQALLDNMRRTLDRQYRRAADTAVVTGATPAAAALQKAAANESYARTLSDVNAQAARFKDGIMDRYLRVQNDLASQKAATYSNRAQQWAEAGRLGFGSGMELMRENGFDFGIRH